MYIDRVYQTLKMLANTDIRGNVSPQEFNLALYNVILEKYEEYLYELTRATNRERRGLANFGLENLPDRIREKLRFYSTSFSDVITDRFFPIPADCRYIDMLLAPDSREVEIKDNAAEFNHINQFAMLSPTFQYPIGLRMGTSIAVSPVYEDGTDFSIVYLRTPKVPKWTYIVVGGAELFNPSASDFQDIDMHIAEEDDIVRRLLIRFGINLKEPDLQTSGNNAEQQENNAQAPI